MRCAYGEARARKAEGRGDADAVAGEAKPALRDVDPGRFLHDASIPGRPKPRLRRGYGFAERAQTRAAAPARRTLRRRIAFVCSCETRDSVTPSTSPISRRVSSS